MTANPELPDEIFAWQINGQRGFFTSADMCRFKEVVRYTRTEAPATQAEVGEPIVPLERIRNALRFYARREHWMGQTENSNRTLLIALGENHKDGHGWEEAEAVESDLWAVEQLINQLSSVKAECLATIDRLNTAPTATGALTERIEELQKVIHAIELNVDAVKRQVDPWRTLAAIKELCCSALSKGGAE
jgi:hypothetical protein